MEHHADLIELLVERIVDVRVHLLNLLLDYRRYLLHHLGRCGVREVVDGLLDVHQLLVLGVRLAMGCELILAILLALLHGTLLVGFGIRLST